MVINVENTEGGKDMTYTTISNCPLPDIRTAKIDPILPSQERIRLFLSKMDNPYRFVVDGTPVEVLFDDTAPTLQHRLTDLGRRMQ